MNTHPARHQPAVASSSQLTDPVCGMSVDATTAHHLDHDRQRYLFCSEHCRARFQADPDRYTHGPADHRGRHDHPDRHDHSGLHHQAGTAPVSAPPVCEVSEYTCPMHPEIRQPGPGSCPICGMALEPVMITADTGPSQELRDMTRRLRVGAALTVPVVALEMAAHVFDLRVISPAAGTW